MHLQLIATEVHDEILFVPGGEISRWVYGIASELHFFTLNEAPLNKRPNKTSNSPPPGHLISMLDSSVTQAGKVFDIVEHSRASYSRYVIEGTGTIYAKSSRIPKGEEGAGQFVPIGEGSGMYLPANPGYGRGRWRQHVRGQRANNFLGRAYDLTARTHPALKGISME